MGQGTNLGTAEGRIRIDTSGVRKAQNEVSVASKAMNAALGLVGVGAGLAGIQQIASMGFQLAETAANANRTRGAFNTLAEGVGENASAMLASMRSASKGMIADADLVLAANRAMLLGVADSSEELASLLEVARVRGEAMGLGLTQAFNDIVTGIGRMSPLILDNLGIVVGGEKAFDAYAKSIGKTADELTDAQKKQFLLNKVIKDSTELVDASKESGDSAATEFERLNAALANTKQQFGELLLTVGIADFLGEIAGAAAQLVSILKQAGDLLNKIPEFDVGGKSDFWVNNTGSNALGWSGLRAAGASIGMWGAAPEGPVTSRTGIGANIREGVVAPRPRPSAAGEAVASGPSDLLKAQVEYNQELASINSRANRDILTATRDYGRQRAETIRQYEQSIVRDAEDFARQRARQQRDYDRQVAAIQRDAQRQEADWAADLGERIAEARAESNDRIAEMESTYARNRERAQEDHRDRILSAAAKLDATAIYNEQKAFSRSQREAAEDHDIALARERANLDKRIAQDQDAADKRLADAREADAQRLADMADARALQLEDEDEDRRIQAERRAADHAAQLNEMAVQQGERIQQITEQAAEERAALNTAFQAQLVELGLYNAAWIKEQKRHQKEATTLFDQMWGDWKTTMQEALLVNPVQGPLPQNPMITPGQFPSLRSGVSVGTIAPTIVINDAGDRSDEAFIALVEAGLIRALESTLP